MSLAPLQKALFRYDPILRKDLQLSGTLHFPEVEKVLPTFYEQLFEKVHIRITVSRKSFELGLEGESESLKDLVRNQFLRIEDELRRGLREVLEQDPIFCFTKVKDHLDAYITDFQGGENNDCVYTFTRSDSTQQSINIPSVAQFVMDPDGKLLSMHIQQKGVLSQLEFSTFERGDFLYFGSILLKQSQGELRQTRQISLSYGQTQGVVYPEKITFSDLDDRGEPLKKSGNLNPVSMILKYVALENLGP
ncbi:MAG: hypothetical protein HQL31_01910 [Planctomycetes bacterium]|nr:hypothetical protein [Planctomycetota bacterium]